MPRKTPPHRGWPLTHFTDDEEDRVPQEVVDLCDYACWAPEICPTTQRLHIQAWVFFKTKRTFEGVKKIFESTTWKGVHLEVQHGTHLENINYVSGPYDKGDKHKPVNDQFTETGIRPQNEPAESYKDRCGRAIKRARAGELHELEEEDPHIFLQFHRTLESLEMFTVEKLPSPSAVWILGMPGVGKSTLADSYVKYGQIYEKDHTPYWDDYKNQPVVVVDEMDKEVFKSLFTHLKHWSDSRPFPAQRRMRSSIMIRPKLLIITSNRSIEELVYDETDRSALLRRFRVVEFTKSTRVFFKFDLTTKLYLEPPLPVGCTLVAVTSPVASAEGPSVVPSVDSGVVDID